jgi:hypothetical protein
LSQSKDGSFTSYQRLQGHATFAFGLAASGDVSKIMLQMPNAAVQLVVDPLFWRGILCFKGGVGGDVHRHFFGPKDFFGKQIKAGGKQVEMNMKLHTKARNRLKENSLSNGTLLWGAVLLDGLLAFVHGLGVFSSGAGEKV